jgi:hypothetical protein
MKNKMKHSLQKTVTDCLIEGSSHDGDALTFSAVSSIPDELVVRMDRGKFTDGGKSNTINVCVEDLEDAIVELVELVELGILPGLRSKLAHGVCPRCRRPV